MTPARPVIALLTDFGLQDVYVGVMKGVIAGLAPTARIIDLTHQIPPQDIATAGFQLASAVPFLPSGTVFCSVVDPGVGTARRPIAVQAGREGGQWTFVAPDNGLLTLVLEGLRIGQVAVLDNPAFHLPRVSATFHGRDVFAPVAAHLALGMPLASLGSAAPPSGLARFPRPEPRPLASGWEGRVLFCDHFGNLVTNLPAGLFRAAGRNWSIRVGDHEVAGLHTTFAAVAPGAPVAYVGSSGHLEVGIRDGSAAECWRAGPGTTVTAVTGPPSGDG